MRGLIAITLALSLQSGFGDEAASLLEQAKTWLEQGEYARAEEVLRQLVTAYPQAPETHLYLGVALLSQSEAEEAAQELEKAYYLSGGPDAAVLFHLAAAYLELGRRDVAERMLHLAAEEAPGDPRIHLLLGWSLYLEARGEEAKAAFARARELSPTAVTHYYSALAELALGNLDKAIDLCRKAIAEDPGLVKAYVLLGRSLAQQGRFEQAREPLEAALGLDGEAAEASYQLGLMDLHAGDLDAARTRFRAAVEAQPTHQPAWYNLAIVSTRLGDHEQAREARARFTELAARSPRRSMPIATATVDPDDYVPIR